MMGIVSGPLLRVKQGERRANMGLTPSWWNSTPLLHLSTSTGLKDSILFTLLFTIKIQSQWQLLHSFLFVAICL